MLSRCDVRHCELEENKKKISSNSDIVEKSFLKLTWYTVKYTTVVYRNPAPIKNVLLVHSNYTVQCVWGEGGGGDFSKDYLLNPEWNQNINLCYSLCTQNFRQSFSMHVHKCDEHLANVIRPIGGDTTQEYINMPVQDLYAYQRGPLVSKLSRLIDKHALKWRHNGRDGVSNHQPRDCSLSRLIRRKSKKTSKLRVTGLFAGNSPVTGEFPAQMASNAEYVSIWWRHHG